MSWKERRERKQLFHAMDMNKNGLLSLAELDRGVLACLGSGMEDLYKAKPVLMRAFNAAKNMSGHDSGVHGAYVDYKEFRALLSYMRQYYEYWVMFSRMDTNHDHRVSHPTTPNSSTL